MQTTRRDVLSFASVGAAGALSLALDAYSADRAGRGHRRQHGRQGPGHRGAVPRPAHRQGQPDGLSPASRATLDCGKQKYFWFKGYVNAVQPGKRVVDLVGAQGFGAIRLIQRPDGAIERLCREIILYTDLRSGEVLQEWKQLAHRGDGASRCTSTTIPFNYLIEEYFPLPPSFGGLNKEEPPPQRPPFVLPWYQHGDWLEMEIHIHLAYPNALQPDKWPRESSGPDGAGLGVLRPPHPGRGHAEPEAHDGRLPRHLEPRHAVAAVDADGPGAGLLPVQLLHGHDDESRARSSRGRCSITPRRITRSTSPRRRNGPVSRACRASSTTRARRSRRRRKR